MTLVEKSDEARVAQAIATAERQTSGEIVAVITANCGTYRYAPILWAAIAALALPWPLIYWTWIQVQHIYAAQIALFAVLTAILMWEPIRYALVPSAIGHQTQARPSPSRRAIPVTEPPHDPGSHRRSHFRIRGGTLCRDSG